MNCEECHKKCRKVIGDYQYTESGLKNVLLKNVPTYQCACGHKIIEIPAFMQLHVVLANAIIQKPTPLNGAEIRFLRKALRKNSKGLASLLDISPVTVTRWEKGTNQISPGYEKVLRALVYTHSSRKLLEHALEEIKDKQEEAREKHEKEITLPLPFIANKALLEYSYASV